MPAKGRATSSQAAAAVLPPPKRVRLAGKCTPVPPKPASEPEEEADAEPEEEEAHSDGGEGHLECDGCDQDAFAWGADLLPEKRVEVI